MTHYVETDGALVYKEEELNFKKWVVRMLKAWPWFLLCILACLGCAFLYVRYANPVYQAVASIMVKDEKKGGTEMDNTVLQEMGLGVSSKLVENETEILKSYDMMEAVVREQDLFVSVADPGRIRDVPLFGKQVPFTLEIANPDTIHETVHWEIASNDTGYLLKTGVDKSAQKLHYGEVYHSEEGIQFRCIPNNDFQKEADTGAVSSPHHMLKVELMAINDATVFFNKKLVVDPVSKMASVINLSIQDNNETRATTILRSLIANYNGQGLDDKNKVTKSTIRFLNERLKAISGDLKTVEGAVADFKNQNGVIDISTDAQQYMTEAQQIDGQKVQSQTQMNIVSALEKDLSENQDNPKLVPSTLGIEEPILGSLIARHNELILQRERLVQKTGPQNPLLIDLDSQIKDIRAKLLLNVRNLKQAYTIALGDISTQDAKLSGRLRKVPTMERKLVQIKRDQNVQEQLYAFLLQKREEASLTLASNIEDSRTIVKARSVDQLSPKPKLALAVAVFMGLLLPVGIISIKDFLNNRIGDQAQVQEKTNLPLLGSISHVRKMNSPIVLNPGSRSIIAEQIRNIRTAIGFAGRNRDVKSILITSFQPGDGKSFISLNLAAAYALLNKKTVLLEFDLRKPAISKMLDINVKDGISSALAGKEKPEELLVEVQGYNSNLFVLPAGYLPPNPAELISGNNMKSLMKTLHENFDVIIIDTPPFSLVTDASLLQRYADISVIVLRQGHTAKDVYPELKLYAERNPEAPLYLLLNDVGKKKRYQNGYSSYKYGKGYYIHEN